ncbi:MAG: hypothetical protein SV253_02745 [Halobacteria archaeon]|nr:hypothetical protein [Halobacteria archaeon]
MYRLIQDSVVGLRQPEYTGENRCIPCTLVNVVIATAVSTAIAYFSVVAGGAVFVVSLAAVYLRGYLVPGTPALTKRYFPDSALRLFGKSESRMGSVGVDGGQSDRDREKSRVEIDVESFLYDSDILTDCDGDDLCLTPEFRDRWYSRIDEIQHSSGPEIYDLLGIDDLLGSESETEVEIDDYGDAFVASVDGVRVGKWESRAAYIADVAAAEVLDSTDTDADADADSDAYSWDDLGYETRTQVLGGLRIWLDRCPDCGEDVSLGQETVESCCSTVDVVAAECEGEDCGARVFEAEYPGM